MTTFQTFKPPSASGVSTQMVWDVISVEPLRPWRVKEIMKELSLENTEFNIKNVANRCIYLTQKRYAVRIDQGIYQALDEKGRSMTTTETQPTAYGAPVVEAVTDEDRALQCQECGFVGRSPMGLRSHITRTHKLDRKLSSDAAFERIGLACETLFPDGIPMSRVIEIANLQKEMLKVLTR